METGWLFFVQTHYLSYGFTRRKCFSFSKFSSQFLKYFSLRPRQWSLQGLLPSEVANWKKEFEVFTGNESHGTNDLYLIQSDDLNEPKIRNAVFARTADDSTYLSHISQRLISNANLFSLKRVASLSWIRCTVSCTTHCKSRASNF